MVYTVYKVTNLVNGKFYIGVHKTRNAFDSYLGSGKMIKLAIKKYGKKYFKKEVLYVFDNANDAFSMESCLVETCNANGDSYNIAQGGRGGNIKNILANGKRVCISEQRLRDPTLSRRATQKARTAKIELEKDKNSPWYNTMIRNISEARKRSDAPSSFIKLNQDTEFQLKRRAAFEKTQHGKGHKNSQFGTIWITDGVQSKKILKQTAIPEGWHRGRRLNKVD